MKRYLKYTLLISTILLAATTAYYLNAVVQAREYTKKVVSMDLAKHQWRKPGEAPVEFELRGHDLSGRQKEILVKVQDPGFYGHDGIDLKTPGAGLTTITQAIVKKLYFKKFRPGIAKIEQTLIACLAVDGLISKDEQVTLFINTMYFGKVDGKPVIGLKSAANAYYRKPLKTLTEEEYISLIAMIVMPSTFHLLDHPEWNRDRTNRIKALLSGKYKPKGLMDQFYGRLPQEVIDSGLPAASYFDKPIKSQ